MTSIFCVLFGGLFLPLTLSLVSVEKMFPFGIKNGDSQLPRALDNFQNINFSTGHVFRFLNVTYDGLFVNSNGIISFTTGNWEFSPSCGPLSLPIIAPFMADTDPRFGGEVFYRETKNNTLLLKASREIQKAHPDLRSLQLVWLFIATWHNVTFYGASKNCNGMSRRNTFQSILATDGHYSFAFFYYNTITWTTGTDSGGGCTGLGGTPAKAGFGLGDGKTFYSIPGSCTPEIRKIANTSNINEPGKWIFQVDKSFESKPCEGHSPNEILRISPSSVSIFGHVPLTIRGPCLENAKNIKCQFYDSSIVTVPGKIVQDNSAVVCYAPFFYSNGKIKIKMIVTLDIANATQNAYVGYIFTTQPEHSLVTFQILQNNNYANLTWNPSFFHDFDFQGGYKLQLHLFEHNGTSWIPRGVLIDGVTNTGSYEGPLDNASLSLIENLKSFILVQLNVVSITETMKSAFSDIIYKHTLTKPQKYFISLCGDWYEESNGPPKDILPCPPLLQQALQDDSFELDGATGDVLQFYHPGAEYSFRQRVPSANGAGQQCVYKKGSIMLGPPGGGTADLYSPKYSYIDHYRDDVWPWLVCCKFSHDFESCRKYYEKRPSDSGHNYLPPRLGNGFGDSHITTFDFVSYTFNAVGEFWMIKEDNDSSFLMQSRMEQFVDENGTLANASIFTSFAMQELNSANTKVHIQLSATYSGIEVLLDREPLFDMASENNETNTGTRSLTYNGVSISQLVSEDGYSTKVTVSFSSGFSFEFTPSGDTALNIIASANAQFQNKTKGLFGVFDGNPANDFTDPNDATISLNSTLQEIHEQFGIKWITTANESIFVYLPGKNHSSYNNPNFVPSFVLPDISSLPSDVITLCGESRDCLFDFAATGSRRLANDTKKVVLAFNTYVEDLNEDVGMCGMLTAPQNGFYLASSYLEGSVARFGCSDGCNLVGQNQLTCTKLEISLRWDYETPKCQKIDIETTYIPMTKTRTSEIPPASTTQKSGSYKILGYKSIAIFLAMLLTIHGVEKITFCIVTFI